MRHFRLVSGTILVGLLLALSSVPLSAPVADASVFSGPGISGGLTAANEISGPVDGDVRTVIIQVVEAVLDFVALIAVIVLIFDGIRLVVSMGKDEEAATVRKSIFHVIIGLILIISARVIVMFIAGILT